MVRGTVVLPHGTGKIVRVAVFAQGDKAQEALRAGADEGGGDELGKTIQAGWLYRPPKEERGRVARVRPRPRAARLDGHGRSTGKDPRPARADAEPEVR